MQIHEITKRQRTDEGILDTVKSAVSAAKTGYKNVANVGTNFQQGLAGQAKSGVRSAAGRFTKTGPVSSAANAAGKVTGKAVDAYHTAGDQWQEKQWDKTQDKRNKQAADAAKILARKGFNVDTTTPAARAQTPTRVKQQQQQKAAQLLKAFDQEFELNPDAAEKAAQQKAAKAAKAAKAYAPQTQQNIAAQNKQMSPQSGIKEGALAQRSQARNAGVTQTPAQTTPNPSGKKDIATDFDAWINQQIPGLANISPDVKAKLNGIFAQMKTLKGNPGAVDKAFQQYVELALASVGNATQGQQGQQSQGGVSASAAYTRDSIAKSLGLEPEALATLQQRIAQNKEQINTTNTGSPTIDKLIQAVTKK
jgi:hypothetical protein